MRVHALRYARRDGVRDDHFADDDRPAEPHPTAYYAWLARSAGQAVLIDTGMGPAADRVPGLHRELPVTERLRALGVPPESIGTVLLTHLHYDHAGGVRDYPAARFVVQQSEVDSFDESWLYDRADLDHLLGSGRLDLITGDTRITPDITVHHVGGHTPGMQIVRVRTAAGHVVVASDAAHFAENLDRRHPSPLTHSAAGTLAAFDRITALAAAPHLVFPGHDPTAPTALP